MKVLLGRDEIRIACDHLADTPEARKALVDLVDHAQVVDPTTALVPKEKLTTLVAAAETLRQRDTKSDQFVTEALALVALVRALVF